MHKQEAPTKRLSGTGSPAPQVVSTGLHAATTRPASFDLDVRFEFGHASQAHFEPFGRSFPPTASGRSLPIAVRAKRRVINDSVRASFARDRSESQRTRKTIRGRESFIGTTPIEPNRGASARKRPRGQEEETFYG